jgi:bifunctional DNA-binding transcriptional regulator/antitoxin component of YhaV-PrlF toxin-antitoxin module
MTGASSMSQVLEIKVNDQGHILISADVSHRLGLNPGMRLVVERADADNVQLSPEPESALVEKDGLLVFTGELLADPDEFIQQERDRRLLELWRRVAQ